MAKTAQKTTSTVSETRELSPLEKCYGAIVAEISNLNKAIADDNLKKMLEAAEALKSAEKQYAKTKAAEVYADLKKTGEPIKNALIMRTFPVIGHIEVKDDGTLVRVEECVRTRYIDLVALCEKCKLSTAWQYKVEKFNQLMTLRAVSELEGSDDLKKAITDKFYMKEDARFVDIGKVPSSKTKIAEMIQKIFDEVLFEDNGKGENIYRVMNKDAEYILLTYTKSGKDALSVVAARNNVMHKLIANVMHRVVTKKVYTVDFKMVETENSVTVPEAPKAEPEKASEQKSESTKKSA